MADTPKPEALNISRPPDFIFKFRGNRVAPAQEVVRHHIIPVLEGFRFPPLADEPDEFWTTWGIDKTQVNITFTEEEKRLGGILVKLKGMEHYAKGHPFPEAIFNVNIAKRVTRNVFYILSKPFSLERWLDAYADLCLKAEQTYVLHVRYMSGFSQEIYLFITRFLQKLGISERVIERFCDAFVSQLDWDNAYRFRVQDPMSTSRKEDMQSHPRAELLRLGAVIRERDPSDTGERMESLIRILSRVLWIPKYRRIFQECIETSDYARFQMDDHDRYHTLLWGDYKFQGKTIDERIAIYQDIHKDGFPPMIEVFPEGMKPPSA